MISMCILYLILMLLLFYDKVLRFYQRQNVWLLDLASYQLLSGRVSLVDKKFKSGCVIDNQKCTFNL